MKSHSLSAFGAYCARALVLIASLGILGVAVSCSSSDGDDAIAPETAPDVQEDIDRESLATLPPDATFEARYAAGAGRRQINPPHSVTMGGFGFCAGAAAACRWTEGVHDDIFATATAVADTETGEVVIFCGIDSAGIIKPDVDVIHARVQRAIYDTYGTYFQGQRLLLSPSHAHSTPDMTGIWGPLEQPRDPEYLELMVSGIVEAAVEAYGALQDAQLDWGTGSAPNYDDDPFAQDEVVWVLRARTPAGDPIFTVTRWSAHPTGYGSENNAVSADYMGPFRVRVEEATGGLSAYLNGPIGSTYATKLHPCGEGDFFPEGFQDPGAESQHESVACVGANLADQVILTLEDMTPLAETGLRFHHSLYEFHPTNLAFMALAKIGALPIEVVDVNDPEAMMISQFSWVTLGELNYLTTPGESFPHFAQVVGKVLTDAGYTNPIVLGLAQDWIGYVLSDENWADEESDISYHKGLCASDNIETPFKAALQALIDAD